MTQKAIAELFGVNVPAISKHLNNIYDDLELERGATISKMETVQKEGNREVQRTIEFYNLDAIISVGYRVNSRKATNFRIWATKVLKEYMQKGFVMDDERLKQGEIVFNSADRTKENMGLMTWKNSPDGRILVSDVTVAKNYLDENSIKRLENVITGYFDYIEDLVNRGKVFTMENFAESINRFLEFREYKVLSGKGSIRKETAEKKA